LLGGTAIGDVQAFRDGSPIDDCDEPTATDATPDPCVESRSPLAGGGVEIVVRSSHASVWNFGTLPPPTLINGKQLQLGDNADPAKKKLTILSKDSAIDIGNGNGSGDDPTSVGLTLRVESAGAGFDNTYTLPAGRWKLLGKAGQNKGYKYTDSQLASGPIKSALYKPSPAPGKPGQIQFTGKGSGLGHDAATNANPVNVEVIAGDERYCMRFGGGTKFKLNSYFKATNAPTSPGCPS
jgi:hypothetical protein